MSASESASESTYRTTPQRCPTVVLLVVSIVFSVAPATKQLSSFSHPYSHVAWSETRAATFFLQLSCKHNPGLSVLESFSIAAAYA